MATALTPLINKVVLLLVHVRDSFRMSLNPRDLCSSGEHAIQQQNAAGYFLQETIFAAGAPT
jgi:hypothetical protein